MGMAELSWDARHCRLAASTAGVEFSHGRKQLGNVLMAAQLPGILCTNQSP